MAKNTNRRRFLVKAAKTTALVAAGGTVVVGGGLGIRALRKRRARVREERRAEIRRKIASSKLSIDPEKWMPFFEIYNFNLGKPATKNFVRGVDGHCKKLGISLRRFFETLHYHPVLPITIRQLETPKTKLKKELAEYRKEAADYKKREKPVPDKVQKKISGLTEEIARLGRIQSVINFCLGHKAAANKAKKDGSLVRVQRVKD